MSFRKDPSKGEDKEKNRDAAQAKAFENSAGMADLLAYFNSSIVTLDILTDSAAHIAPTKLQSYECQYKAEITNLKEYIKKYFELLEDKLAAVKKTKGDSVYRERGLRALLVRDHYFLLKMILNQPKLLDSLGQYIAVVAPKKIVLELLMSDPVLFQDAFNVKVIKLDEIPLYLLKIQELFGDAYPKEAITNIFSMNKYALIEELLKNPGVLDKLEATPGAKENIVKIILQKTYLLKQSWGAGADAFWKKFPEKTRNEALDAMIRLSNMPLTEQKHTEEQQISKDSRMLDSVVDAITEHDKILSRSLVGRAGDQNLEKHKAQIYLHLLESKELNAYAKQIVFSQLLLSGSPLSLRIQNEIELKPETTVKEMAESRNKIINPNINTPTREKCKKLEAEVIQDLNRLIKNIDKTKKIAAVTAVCAPVLDKLKKIEKNLALTPKTEEKISDRKIKRSVMK